MPNNPTIKHQLLNKSKVILQDRLNVLQNEFSDLQNTLQSETKSSAGDKHETGRALLQLKREQLGQQLADIQKQIQMINSINPKNISNFITLGSVIETTHQNYFISLSLGEIKIKKTSYFAISPLTPI